MLIETAKSLAKEQYAIYSMFGIHKERPKQETSFKANQPYLP